eukprot:6190940-Pleurochrysis_carterae.AAC.2
MLTLYDSTLGHTFLADDTRRNCRTVLMSYASHISKSSLFNSMSIPNSYSRYRNFKASDHNPLSKIDT